MGLFDYFKKKHKQENTDKKPEIVEESTISYVKQPTTSIYDGISVDGEVLKKVYSQNIQNSVVKTLFFVHFTY